MMTSAPARPDFYLAASASTPEVDFRFHSGRLLLRGVSCPDDAAAFYDRLFRPLTPYLADRSHADLELTLALTRLDTASANQLLTLADLLNNAQAKGWNVHCHVFHDEDDARLQAFYRVLAYEFPGLLAAPLAQVA
ncbi:SiaC family regulatory phosphoprotein [Pseudogulbenkiania sp. MAI-1]|uniref:SiaC family regulatory phosphoprotein n=1 Tax=Pseudogulbenkiania sp. MAI-1 TaxID=990370 RepID=UPI00045E920D|nr:SiaC family regulatory phosphoprotein [Pseudogulbenkiania sp. MAI-1]